MPSLSSPSNMTAHRSAVGRSRKTDRRCRRAGGRGQGDLAVPLAHGAGRTFDAGGPCAGAGSYQDIEKQFAGRLRDGLNAHLRPNPIGVLSAEIVPDTFEARFSAKKRHYLYRITNTRANLALDIGCLARTAASRCRCDARSHRPAAARQARFHDPRYRVPGEIAGEDARSARRHQKRRCREHRHFGAPVPANKSQVRSMVGSLVWVGEGRWSADDLAAALLAARNRAAQAPSPPDASGRCGWSIE